MQLKSVGIGRNVHGALQEQRYRIMAYQIQTFDCDPASGVPSCNLYSQQEAYLKKEKKGQKKTPPQTKNPTNKNAKPKLQGMLCVFKVSLMKVCNRENTAAILKT